MESSIRVSEGNGWASVKAEDWWHYFRDGNAVCANGLTLDPDQLVYQGNHGHPNNCPECKVARTA